MIDINLLPPEYGPQKLITPINMIIIFLSTLICLSLLFSSMKLMSAVQDYSTRLDSRENQVKYYRRQVEDIHELAVKVKLLRERLVVVEELLHERKTWSDKLIELSDCLPGYGAWMNTLTIERAKERTRANEQPTLQPIIAYVSGGCKSVDKISQFVARLETSDTFGNVMFDSATTDVVDGDTVVTFKVAVELLGSGG